MGTATKTGIAAAKTTSTRVVQIPAEAPEDLVGNKIADKITLTGKTKCKEEENETNKRRSTRKRTKTNCIYILKPLYLNHSFQFVYADDRL